MASRHDHVFPTYQAPNYLTESKYAACGDAKLLHTPEIEAIKNSNALLIESAIHLRCKGEGLGVYDYLYHTSGFKTSEPRDRLFALTGLPISAAEWYPLPDYQSTPEEVFRDFIVLDIVYNESTKFLSWVNTRGVDREPGGTAPSWTPNFSIEAPPLFHDYMAHKYDTSASGDTAISAQVNEDKTILTIKGRIVGLLTITGLTRVDIAKETGIEPLKLPMDYFDKVARSLENVWFKACLAILGKIHPEYEDLESLLASEEYVNFLHVLCCDWDPIEKQSLTRHDIKVSHVAIWSHEEEGLEWDQYGAVAYSRVQEACKD